MGQALYRKYRSRSLDEVVGQEAVVKTLKNALKTGRISHAYLFTGPRGTGKTSIARILAHEVNGLEYTDESIHLDIIEIDAASNRRIDEIRELRDKVHIAPTSAKYKVYIIDEVHMLTKEAFNALLKTLEEPPAHCIFILATTEVHKLPETIISRTQHFNFKPIEHASVIEHLVSLAKAEGLKVDSGALELLANHGSGSMRDSISLLDQLASKGDVITEEMVREVVGMPPAQAVSKIIQSVVDANRKFLIETLDTLREYGTNPALLAKAIASEIRQSILEDNSELWKIKLLRRLSKVASSPNPQEQIEIDLLEAATSNNALRVITPPEITKTPPTPAVIKPEPEAETQTKESENAEGLEPMTSDHADAEPVVKGNGSDISTRQSNAPEGDFDLERWPDVVARAKTEAASLYTALRLGDPRNEDGKLMISFQFPLHQKKLSQNKNIDILGQIIEEVCGIKVAIEAIVDKNLKPKINKRNELEPMTVVETAPELEAISNIFGSAEVLES